MYDPRDYFEIPLTKGGVIRKETSRPGQVYLDISFSNSGSNEFDTLLFQNFYTASISIVQQSSTGFNSIVLENYQLMENPYGERGSQSWFVIKSSEFNSLFVKGKPIRIVLFQPSPQWFKFEIRNVKALNRTGNSIKNSVINSDSYSYSTNKNVLDCISDTLWSDFKLLKEAAKAQMNLTDNYADHITAEHRKSSKKKDKKKSDKRHSISNTVSGNAPVTAGTPLQSSTVGTASTGNLTT